MKSDEYKSLQTLLEKMRDGEQDCVIVSIGTHAPNVDAFNGYVSVTAEKAGLVETGNAVALADAHSIARAKLKTAIAAREKARAKAALEKKGETK